MNKYQKALDYLVSELQGCDEAISDKEMQKEYNQKREEANKTIQELVNKSTPKKPTYEGDGYVGYNANGELIYDAWYCPCCDKRYEVDYDNYNYCPSCGQAIDWSDENV